MDWWGGGSTQSLIRLMTKLPLLRVGGVRRLLCSPCSRVNSADPPAPDAQLTVPAVSKSESCRFSDPLLQTCQDSPLLRCWKFARDCPWKVPRSPELGFALQARLLPPFRALARCALDALRASR